MTIAFVQKGANSQVGGAGNQFNTPTITGVTAGNWLVAVGWGTGDSHSALTPPSGWTLAANSVGVPWASPAELNSAIFFKKSTAGGTESCQFDWFTSGAYSEAAIIEVSVTSGVLTLGPTATGSGTSGTTATAGPTSATSAQTLVVGVAQMLDYPAFAGTNIGVGQSGYTSIYNDALGTIYLPGDSVYKIVSAGAQTATWTWTNSSNWIANLATFVEGSAGTSLTPGVGALALSGFAPTVARTANQAISPGVKALTLSGFAPTVARTANQAVAPGVGALTLTGFAPTVSQSAGLNLTPGVAALVLAGYAPSLAQTANQSLTPGVGSLALTGYAPTIGQPQAVSPGVGALSLTGFAPTVTQSANQGVSPGTGALSLTGYAPSIGQTANQAVVPGVGALSITGFAPVVTVAAGSPSLFPGAAVLAITGYAPDVAQASPTTGGVDTWGGVYVRKKKKPEVTVAGPPPGPTVRESIEQIWAAAEERTLPKQPVRLSVDFDEDEEEVLMLLT